jgi:DNA-binding LacI/PurR family transcriptional regulator
LKIVFNGNLMSLRTPTIKDVAKLAGVGVGTVSRVLNGSTQVTEDTRQKVLSAIETLNFRPNRHAQSLPTQQRTYAVGILAPYITAYSFVERLQGAQRALREIAPQFELLLYNVETPEQYREQLARILRARLVDGVLNVSLPFSQDDEAALQNRDIAFVYIGGDSQDSVKHSLGIDNQRGAFIATKHLLEMEHRHIAYIGDAYPDGFGFRTGKNRHIGYLQALSAYGITPSPIYIQLGPHGRDIAKAQAIELASLRQPPTAIFAMSDLQALGVISGIREAGLRVPEDISVIGFDDIEISHYAGLTTVAQHLDTSGYLGIRYLLSLIETRNSSESKQPEMPILPDLQLKVRQTTLPPAGARSS